MEEDRSTVFTEPALGPALTFECVIQGGGHDEPEKGLADAIARMVQDELQKNPGDFPLPDYWDRARFRVRLTLERISDEPDDVPRRGV
jgi:hypothetical protein